MEHRILIDGEYFSIPILDLPRTADILDKVAERTESGLIYREIIGTFINHNGIIFGTIDDLDTYEALYDKLIEPIPYHEITLPINNKYANAEWYISGVQDTVDKVLDNGTRFKALTCNLIAAKPVLTP